MDRWLKNRYVHLRVGQWEYLLTSLLWPYLVYVTWRVVSSTATYLWQHLFSEEGLSRWHLLRIGVFIVCYVLALVGVPYWALRWYANRAMKKLATSEPFECRVRRDTLAEAFDEGDDSIVTIFLPDAFEDEYSVAAYTGTSRDLIPDGYGSVKAQRAACIIANPHIAQWSCSSATSNMFTFPEVTATWDARGYLLPRLQRYISSLFYYIFRSELRANLPRIVSVSDTQPYACGQLPDINKATQMVVSIMDTDPTPNRTKYVLYGVGRGANVIPSVMARLKKAHLHHIRGIVLEGPLTNEAFVRSCRWPYFDKHPTEKPIDLVHEMQHMPILHGLQVMVVTSDADSRVDKAAFFKLTKYLRTMSMSLPRHVRLRDAPAGQYATHNGIDACVYEEAAQAFYASIASYRPQDIDEFQST